VGRVDSSNIRIWDFGVEGDCAAWSCAFITLPFDDPGGTCTYVRLGF